MEIEDRDLAEMLGLGRVVIGAACLLAPKKVARAWTGETLDTEVSKMGVRGIGARDVAIGLGILVSLDNGRPVRGWLEASAIADFADAFGTLTGWKRLPKLRRWGLLALEAGAGVIGMQLAAALDD